MKVMKLMFLPSIVICNLLYADVCDDWFEKSGIKQTDADCLLKCSSLPVGMGTFYCTKECYNLCSKIPISDKLIFKFAYYPGLTDAEKALITKSPDKALHVYQQMRIAEERTDKYFPKGLIDDESDAFRHFVWACLLYKELGSSDAQLFLDAHENNYRQPTEQKAMDLANNRAGLLEAERLKKSNFLDLKNIETKALEYLKQSKLVILKPSGQIPKEVLP
jgi:hypothetical protein